MKCANMTNTPGCARPIAMIDSKGYVYCATCGRNRQGGGVRCRTLTPAELAKLEQGEQVSRVLTVPVYLLHFDRPFAHARHYLGWSATMASLHRRVDHHYAGTSGARLMEQVKKAGISFTLARVWEDGTKQDERRMKQRGHARMCPICRELSPPIADLPLTP